MSTYTKAREAFHDALQQHDGTLPCQRADVDGNDWFAKPGSPRELTARKRCLDCPIFWECQGYAIEAGVPNGTWGGVDEQEREGIWKRMPGGKPKHFIEEMDAATLPLLQERRDHENFDANAPADEPAELDWWDAA